MYMHSLFGLYNQNTVASWCYNLFAYKSNLDAFLTNEIYFYSVLTLAYITSTNTKHVIVTVPILQ